MASCMRRIATAADTAPRTASDSLRKPVQRLWRRLAVLEERANSGQVAWPSVRASVASWLGLAKHADAFRLSCAIFRSRDVRNIGKRLLVASLSRA
jgi:hypothetical protein